MKTTQFFPGKITRTRLTLSFLALVPFLAGAQQFPATITLPVTFYDYHGDGSNPDFEPGLHVCGSVGCATFNGLHLNEVANTLDPQRKPLLGTTPFFSDRVAKWYRSWQPGDNTIPIYSTAGAYLRDTTINTDTSYKNVVIPSTLMFTYVPGSQGLYTYNSQAFFPLDGMGFGEDDPGGQNPPHNFSFTMELHCQFTYQDNLTFNFTGDDDVFVFINGTQVIDLGGIHGPTNAAVNLNTLGLQPGQKYMFDLFYAERHATGSDILITTNLFTPPGYLRLYSKPDTASTDLLNGLDTVAAGVTFPIYAQVFDSLGNWVPSSDNLVSWTLTDALGNPLLSSATGASTSFTPTEAYGTAVVTATFSDPNNPGKVLTTKITLYIGPGAGTHVVIEADSLARNTRNDRPVGTINVDRTTNATVYAVVRDSFGNFVRFANNATWSTADPGVASATPLATKQWAASVAEKGFGSTTLTASEPGLTAGTAVVSATSPNSAVPVTATLLDIDGDGHLDRIDITLPDSVSLAAALPTVQQWIQSMYIVTDDGGSKVTLTAASMTADGAHTIHVVLTQNTGSTLETGWSSATITLSAAPMTTDGRALVVANIVDGAQPVVKSVCFVPTAVGDTLRVIFSEPPANANPALDVYALISVVQQNGSLIPVTAAAVAVVKLANSYLYVFAGNTLSGLDTAKAGVRAFPLELCGDIPIILNTKAVGNPFVPGVTQIPPKWRGTGDPLSGARIEVTFLRAIEPDVLNGNVRATITIYDAVGNALVDNKDMKIDSKNIADNVKLYFIWDGKTSKGSLAAPGTYLARMTVQDITRGRTQTVRMNVGIKK